MPTAFDVQQQHVVAGEPDGHVTGRDRLHDQRRRLGRQGVPHQHGTVPALLGGAQQATLDPGGQLLQRLRAQADLAAVASGDVDCGRSHDATGSGVESVVGVPIATRKAARKAAGCSRGGSSPASSIICSGQP